MTYADYYPDDGPTWADVEGPWDQAQDAWDLLSDAERTEWDDFETWRVEVWLEEVTA